MPLVMTRDELKAECDRLGFRPPVYDFNISDVPENLRELAPYAEIWGNNSDETRWQLVKETPEALKEHLQELIFEPDVQDRFDEWLAGPESNKLPPTTAYLAFTCLRMAADEMG